MGDVGDGVTTPQRKDACFLGPFGSSGHLCEVDTCSREEFAEVLEGS